jgi:hypothetical protein
MQTISLPVTRESRGVGAIAKGFEPDRLEQNAANDESERRGFAASLV